MTSIQVMVSVLCPISTGTVSVLLISVFTDMLASHVSYFNTQYLISNITMINSKQVTQQDSNKTRFILVKYEWTVWDERDILPHTHTHTHTHTPNPWVISISSSCTQVSGEYKALLKKHAMSFKHTSHWDHNTDLRSSVLWGGKTEREKRNRIEWENMRSGRMREREREGWH